MQNNATFVEKDLEKSLVCPVKGKASHLLIFWGHVLLCWLVDFLPYYEQFRKWLGSSLLSSKSYLIFLGLTIKFKSCKGHIAPGLNFGNPSTVLQNINETGIAVAQDQRR